MFEITCFSFKNKISKNFFKEISKICVIILSFSDVTNEFLNSKNCIAEFNLKLFNLEW